MAQIDFTVLMSGTRRRLSIPDARTFDRNLLFALCDTFRKDAVISGGEFDEIANCVTVHLAESGCTAIAGTRGESSDLYDSHYNSNIGHLTILGSDRDHVLEGADELRRELEPYNLRIQESRE